MFSILFCLSISALPEAEFADTEVSTNIEFAVGTVEQNIFRVELELDAGISNNVEVVFGVG